ncbi:hypothetical protein ACKWTF_015871 [Chironomus riparius]
MDESCSLAEALTTLSSPNYGPYSITKDKTIKINFVINEKLSDELNATSFTHYFPKDHSVRLTFRSTVEGSENKIFWKLRCKEQQKQPQKFCLLHIDDDSDGAVTDYCQNHIDDGLVDDFHGIPSIFKNKKNLNVKDLKDKNDLNLLILAVIRNQIDIVDKLLKYDFDLDYEVTINPETEVNFTAIDKAWDIFSKSIIEENKVNSSQIIISLLNANSRLPKVFNYDTASDGIKKFLDECEALHQLIRNDNFEDFKEELNKYPNLWHIYNKNNVSLMSVALQESKNKCKFVDFLFKSRIYPGQHEAENVSKLLENFQITQKRLWRKKRQINAEELFKAHVFTLISKTKVSNYDRRHQERYRLILEAFKNIDQHEGCRKVLKIAAACKKVQIFFDFKHDSTYYFDPLTSLRTSGTTYGSGVIEIGAKGLLDENKKFEVIGVLIHELCHLAVLMTYMNNFDPFQMGESEDKRRFVEEVRQECEGNQDFEDLIGSVFVCYPKEHFDSELIVRPYHIKLHYQEYSQRIADCEAEYPQLFNYVNEVVEPEFDKALPVLKKLQNDEEIVKFDDLTDPMKAKVLQTEIYFQGMETSLFNIIGNDTEILQLLTSEQIKDILLNRKDLKFGDICEIKLDYSYTERKFLQIGMEHDLDSKNFEDVKNLVENSRVFVLSGKAGEGKTTTFRDLTKKLKEKFQNFWVSFVKLRKFKDIFDNLDFLKDLNIDELCQIFCAILIPSSKDPKFNIETNFEVRIFKKLFLTGKVILLLDGVDEICPKFNDFIIKISKLIKFATKNQLWVSTRPQHAQQLEKALDTEIYNLIEYYNIERTALIKEILEVNSKLIDDVTLEKFENLFINFDDFNNPLLITIIAELYAKDKIDLEFDSLNRFGIYKALVDEQMRKTEEKIDFDDRKSSLNFPKMLQVLALKFMLEPELIENLSVIKNWKNDKKNWTAEKIQRFGFVIVDLDFLETDNKNSIDFIHNTVAEYLLTQLILDYIFNEEMSDKIMEKIFNILKSLETKWRDENFLSSSLKIKFSENCKLHEKLKDLIVKNIEDEVEENDNLLLTKINFWCQFLQNDVELLRKLWKIDSETPLISQLLPKEFSNCVNDFGDLLKNINNCLGDNWHKILNKNVKNVEDCSDFEDLSVMKIFEDKEKIEHFKNFLKLLNLIDETFDFNDKEKFRKSLYSLFKIVGSIHLRFESSTELFGSNFKKCFSKILKIFPNDKKMFFLILNQIIQLLVESEKFSCFEEILIEFCENDVARIQNYLFNGRILSSIAERIEFDPSRNDEIKISGRENFCHKFTFFMDLFLKYKTSIEQIQNDIKLFFNIYTLLRVMPDDFLPTFTNYMKMIFESNSEKLFEFVGKGQDYFDIRVFVKLEEFLFNFFDGNDEKVRTGMRISLFRESRPEYDNPDFNENSAKNLEEIIKICKKYQNPSEELK